MGGWGETIEPPRAERSGHTIGDRFLSGVWVSPMWDWNLGRALLHDNYTV
ncbi:hypothetical protein GCM10023334_033470 [Nonomuraea thailandensis]